MKTSSLETRIRAGGERTSLAFHRTKGSFKGPGLETRSKRAIRRDGDARTSRSDTTAPRDLEANRRVGLGRCARGRNRQGAKGGGWHEHGGRIDWVEGLVVLRREASDEVPGVPTLRVSGCLL